MTNMKWPENLVIVRHGQSDLNATLDLLEDNLVENLQRQKIIRDVDIPLTEEGYRQVRETGIALSKSEIHFDICFSSPYKRALETARVIIENLGYNVRIFQDERLREKEFGRLHGMTTEEIRQRYPEEFEARERDGKYWYRFIGGENYPDVGQRVHMHMDKLVRDCGGQHVLVITHQVPYYMFRALFEHLDENGVLALERTPNCGVMEFVTDTSKYPEGRMKLACYNEKLWKEE